MLRFPVFLLLMLSVLSSLVAQVPYSEELHAHREKYKQGFVQDGRSPLGADDLQNLDFFPPDSTWKLQCSCSLTENAKPFELPTYSGVTRTYIQFATAVCQRNQVSFAVQLYKNLTQPANPLYASHLFLPFKDETNSDTSYGGGRYINLSSHDIADNMLTIDFNKCYNPWCAYSDGYNCPIPPKENHFPFLIEAGEKNYQGQHKTRK
jgi:uncharacterized protein (DUF1684 family)